VGGDTCKSISESESINDENMIDVDLGHQDDKNEERVAASDRKLLEQGNFDNLDIEELYTK